MLHQQIRPQNDPKAEFRLRVIAREDRENMPGNHLSQVMQFAEKLGEGKQMSWVCELGGARQEVLSMDLKGLI